jgi:hypothetical protein
LDGFDGARREDDCPAPPCSFKLLFFDIWDYDGDAVILVVTSVFTHIC